MLSKEGTTCITQQQCLFDQNCTLRAGSPARTAQGGAKGCLNGAQDRVPRTLCSSSASARPETDRSALSPTCSPCAGSSLWFPAGESQPCACRPELSGCLRPPLALAVCAKLLAGTGDASRQLLPICSRARQ